MEIEEKLGHGSLGVCVCVCDFNKDFPHFLLFIAILLPLFFAR